MSEIWQLSSNLNPAGEAVLAAKDPPLQWYAAYTTPRHEKHVAELLAERDIETFLPLISDRPAMEEEQPDSAGTASFPVLFVRSGSVDLRGDLFSACPACSRLWDRQRNPGLCHLLKSKLYGSERRWARSSRIHT